MNLDELSRPFNDDEIEWRIQRGGTKNGKPWAIIVPYVQNRAIMDRLDAVAGRSNWRNEFTQFNNGVVCGISILVNSEWVTKWDGAAETNIESFKGGLSDAMKRAAVQWGIGRHLYDIPTKFANIHEGGKYKNKIDDVWVSWDAPSLDDKPRAKSAPKPKPEPADPAVESGLALQAILDRLVNIKTIFELRNWKKKHAAEWKRDLTDDDMAKLGVAYKLKEDNLEPEQAENDDPPVQGQRPQEEAA